MQVKQRSNQVPESTEVDLFDDKGRFIGSASATILHPTPGKVEILPVGLTQEQTWWTTGKTRDESLNVRQWKNYGGYGVSLGGGQ